GTFDGVFKSFDGGTSWTAVNNGLSNTFIDDLVIDPLTPTTIYANLSNDGLFKSTNGGNNWIPGNGNLPSSGGSPVVINLAVNPITSTTLYASLLSDGIYKSTDGGNNWVSVWADLPGDYIKAIVIDSTNPNMLYAGSRYAGVFKSTDGGDSWTIANQGLTNSRLLSIAIDPINPDNLYAGQLFGIGEIFKSTDGGKTWSTSSQGISKSYDNDIRAIVTNPISPTTLYVSTAREGVFKSINGGIIWSVANTGLPNGMVLDLVVHPFTPTVLYAGTYDGVYKSLNEATSWIASNQTMEGILIYTVAIDPIRPNIIYAGTFQNIFKSTDGGDSWAPIIPGLVDESVIDIVIDPTNSNTIYATVVNYNDVRGRLLKSTDEGTSWTDMSAGLPDTELTAIVIDPKAPDTLYIATDFAGVYRTVDGGVNWSAMNVGFNLFNEPYILDLAIDPRIPTKLYVATSGHGVMDFQFNEAPTLDLNGNAPGINYTTTFTQTNTPVAIVDNNSLTVSDIDNTILNSASITITNLLDGMAEMLTIDTTGTNISASHDNGAGVLTLIGTDTVTNYQQVLRTAAYNNSTTNLNTNSRIIYFTINDGASNSALALTVVTISIEDIEPDEYKSYLPILFKPNLNCPTIPILLSPTNKENVNTLIPTLTWDSGNDPKVTAAEIEIIHVNSGSSLEVENEAWKTGVNSYIPRENLEKAETYLWRVRLRCGDTWGDYSLQRSFTPVYEGAILPASKLISPADGSTVDSTVVTFQWSAIPGAIEYTVHIADNDLPFFVPIVTTPNTQVTLNLDSSTTYLWRVTARDNNAYGQESETWEFTTPE
ncbi:MAG: hypothetical protein GWN30_14415, partial [Gammaproteobacteria bacterium]|nr:hypothetical protein [Gammaproteobacteria bacterium]NIX02756.1 hypothetical protein [Phycisphaerae bacterium]